METNVNVQANDEVEIDLKEIMFLLLEMECIIMYHLGIIVLEVQIKLIRKRKKCFMML